MALQVECHRCGYDWKYTGSSEYYASCPQCKTSVPLEGDPPEPEGSAEGSSANGGASAAQTGDIDGLAARVEQLETTASDLHDVIETMMARVADLEEQHARAVRAASGAATSTPSPDDAGPDRAGGDIAGAEAGQETVPADGGATHRRDGGRPAEGAGSTASQGRRETEPRDGTADRPEPSRGRAQATDTAGNGASDPETADGRRDDGPDRAGSAGESTAGGGGIRPEPDQEGSYDYVCPNCDGPISGEPEACIHCGTAFRW